MSTDDSSSLVPLSSTTELEKSISSLNQPLADYLVSVGLPTENVLSPIAERGKVITQLESALSILPIQEREKAFYLTKFTSLKCLGVVVDPDSEGTGQARGGILAALCQGNGEAASPWPQENPCFCLNRTYELDLYHPVEAGRASAVNTVRLKLTGPGPIP